MQMDKFTLPYTLRVINTIGAGLRALRLPIYEFKEETLLQRNSVVLYTSGCEKQRELQERSVLSWERLYAGCWHSF